MTKNSMWRKMMLTLSIAALVTVAFSCKDDDDDSNQQRPNYTISGNAAGGQMVPAVTGNGTGGISGTYNPNTNVLTYTNTWSDLSGAPTGGGFYSGASGVNGTAVGSPWTFDTNATGTGTNTSSMMLTEDQGNQLSSGNWYYGYNTAANASGETRGQITATQMN